jgi:4-hydroxy-3-polyprenylbenzoate decarboxylase
VVIAAAGEKRRELWTELPAGFELPRPFDQFRMILPGILAVEAPAFSSYEETAREIDALNAQLRGRELAGLPLLILCDDAGFTAASLNNFVWVTFTRSNPSHDIHGVENFIEEKHWGCRGPLIIDARSKPHHAPPLVEDPEVERRVERLLERLRVC